MSVCPPRACKSEVIYRWIFFLFFLPLGRPVLACLLLFRAASFFVSSLSRPSSVSSSCPCARSTGQRRAKTSDPFFFYSALASSRLRKSATGGGARAREAFFFIPYTVYTRECVAGVNQSTSSRIRLYSTLGVWMTSRGCRDEARCARKTRLRTFSLCPVMFRITIL